MQVAQRSFNRGPDMDPGAQRQERLNGLRNGASEIQNVNRAATQAEGTQMYHNLNAGNGQPRNVADLMKTPQGKIAVNQVLNQLWAWSFQGRVDWINNNPALARQVFEMAKMNVPVQPNTMNNSRVNTMPNGQFNVGGVNINRQQTGGYAHGISAANEAGSIGG